MRRISNKSENRKHRAQSRARWLFFLGCVAGLAVAAGAGLIRTQAQQAFPLPAIDPPGAKASSTATQTAPASEHPAQQQAGTQGGNANTPEVARQCADLLKLATDLKTAVDKSSASTLSVTVFRKAREIEQLAHKVRVANGKS